MDLNEIIQELRLLRGEISEIKSLLNKAPEPNPKRSVLSHNVEGLDGKITALFHELKILANLQGYTYLREAIKLVYQDSNLLRGFTNELYPTIATKYNSTPSRVERSIRHAIETSYNRHYFHPFYQNNYVDRKPTNAQFIAEIVDMFKQEPYKEEKE